MPDDLYPRCVERLIGDDLLAAFPAVFVVGPRGCGKSTSMSRFADTVIDLSEPGTRMAAAEDPDGVLSSSKGTVLIDEWQEAPEILGAVKRAVDADRGRQLGRFIVTGSVRAAHHAATWPGTGRLIRVRMFGLAEAELERLDDYNPIDAFFSRGRRTYQQSALGRDDYIVAIVTGRFPAAQALTPRNRSRWYSAYIEQLIDRDVVQISGRAIPAAKLRNVLGSAGARTGRELNKQAIASDAAIDFRTADAYIALLEDLSIIARVPAWHATRVRRLTQSPKLHITDPGMAAHLLNVDSNALGRDSALVGQLFESFVVTELLTHLETSAADTAMFHLRNRDGNEVDVVLERHGTVVGLEVKSSTSVDRADARGLAWLRDRLGEKFVFGAVLYSGALPYEISDRVWALPISTLWRPPSLVDGADRN